MLFWKQFGLVIQIAIVVAAVLLFSFFDPFGLLKSKKMKLEDTPINVQSIQEIGQLITAEYYGEVLNSLQQSLIAQVMDQNDSVINDFRRLHVGFQNAIASLVEEKDRIKLTGWNKKKNLYDYFYYRYGNLTDDPYYQDYIKWLIGKTGAQDEKRLLKDLFDQDNQTVNKFNVLKDDDLVLADLKKITDERVNILTADKKFKKQQIVVLGRGWVKAGIDFGTFTQSNFRYDKANKTIHLIGLKPEILVCSINPWFIPEKQVKGFEVVLVSRKANEPKYMQIVKEETLKKLRSNAIEANILAQARKNAETNLKDFFSLLLEDGIDKVVIHDSFFSYFDASITSETLDPDAMKSIDSLFVKRFKIDSLDVIGMRDTLLANRKIIVGEYSFKAQRYSSLLSFIEDEELTAGELSRLENLRKAIQDDRQYLHNDSSDIGSFPLSMDRLDTVWYYPSKSAIKSMNDALKASGQYIPEKKFSIRKILKGDTGYTAWDSAGQEKLNRAIYSFMLDQKEQDFELIVDQIKNCVAQFVLNDTTFINKSKYVNDEKSVNSELESQYIVYTNEVNKKINEQLSIKPQKSMDLSGFFEMEKSLLAKMDKQKPYLIHELRDSIQQNFAYCLMTDCYPAGRYLEVLATAQDSAIVTSKNIIRALDKEDSLIQLIISDLWNDGLRDIDLNERDSLWYFPSLLMIENFKDVRETKYPEGKSNGFFNNLFNKKAHKKWLREKEYFVVKSIYQAMLDKKLQDVQQTKLNLTRELELKERNLKDSDPL